MRFAGAEHREWYATKMFLYSIVLYLIKKKKKSSSLSDVNTFKCETFENQYCYRTRDAPTGRFNEHFGMRYIQSCNTIYYSYTAVILYAVGFACSTRIMHYITTCILYVQRGFCPCVYIRYIYRVYIYIYNAVSDVFPEGPVQNGFLCIQCILYIYICVCVVCKLPGKYEVTANLDCVYIAYTRINKAFV